MKRSTYSSWTLVGALALLAACNPRAVDPDAEFTIEGYLVDENGNALTGTQLSVYKVDHFDTLRWHDDAFLHSVNLRDQPGVTAVYAATSDSRGEFSLTLQGSQVNTESGGGAAFLTAVLSSPVGATEPDALMATATEWFYFRDENPTWDVGTLALWSAAGMTATQSNDVDLDFDWGSATAPSGFERDNDRPYFLFAYEFEETGLWWGEHTNSTGVTLPRSAFNNDAEGPDYFLVGYSQELSGSRRYMHRTGWRNTISNYQAFAYQDRMDAAGARMLDSDGFEIITDGLLDPWNSADLSTGTTEIYIDLGSVQSFYEILVYGLGVRNFHNATITISSSTESSSVPPAFGSSWTEHKQTSGDIDFGNWLYLGYSVSGSGTLDARWIRIQAEAEGGTGVEPSLLFIDEVSVKY